MLLVELAHYFPFRVLLTNILGSKVLFWVAFIIIYFVTYFICFWCVVSSLSFVIVRFLGNFIQCHSVLHFRVVAWNENYRICLGNTLRSSQHKLFMWVQICTFYFFLLQNILQQVYQNIHCTTFNLKQVIQVAVHCGVYTVCSVHACSFWLPSLYLYFQVEIIVTSWEQWRRADPIRSDPIQMWNHWNLYTKAEFCTRSATIYIY